MFKLYSLESFQKEKNVSRQSAINLISRLRKEGKVVTTGGGKQPRLYKIYDRPIEYTNGLYDLVKKYTPISLVPRFRHYVYGKKYNVERAIVDLLNINDSRHHLAALFLMNNIKDWSKFKNYNFDKELFLEIYELSRKTTKARKIPLNYLKDLQKTRSESINHPKMLINKNDVYSAKGDVL